MARDANAARSSQVEQGLIARAAGAIFGRKSNSPVVSGPDNGGPKRLISGDVYAFFGPGQPIAPQAQQDAIGRQFDYRTGYNLQIRPRVEELIDFPTLRALADNYDLCRLAIETRKDQMGKLQWQIQRKSDGEVDATAQKMTDFLLDEPDGEHDFGTWQRMLLEDLLVLDAPCVYVRKLNRGGDFLLEPIDGATIKRNLSPDGRTPQSPDPAYQQIIKGLPAADYDRSELLYLPRNPRTHKVYGFGPVEQIVLIANIALRREISQLNYYTDGNVPDTFIQAPKGWNPNQIRELQGYFDEILSGDSAARRRVRIIPGESSVTPMKSESLFDMFDEWLARVVCYAFSLPPTAFVKQMNRATSENAQEVALEEGLAPLMEWQVRFMNRLIRLAWKRNDYVFAWQDEQDIDPQVQMQIDVGYTGGTTGNGPKIRSVQEVRDDHDWGPLPKELQAEADAALEAKQNPPPAPGATDGGQMNGAGGAGTAIATQKTLELTKARHRRRL